MKRGTIIIGRDEETNAYIKEMNERERHALIMQEYCEVHGIETFRLDGTILGITLAKHGELVFQIDDLDIIIYIPALVTNYQLETFKECVKNYLDDYAKRYTWGCSYYFENNKDEVIAIGGKLDENINWKLIYENIKEKNKIFNEIKGEKDVQNVRRK